MSETLEHSHDVTSIAERIGNNNSHSYLKDFVYGAIDGTVTTFAVVSGVAGAGLSPRIVVILGLANLLGDGFSMAASNYLGTRTEEQLRDKARAMEEKHIRLDPDGETEEVRQIFAAKGFEGETLDRAVETVTANKERWIDVMMVDELGLMLNGPSPIKAALATFVSFVLVGLLPLLCFLFGYQSNGHQLYFVSTVVTGLAFFLVGAAKSFFVEQKWYRSGLETLTIGGIAALLAYLVGLALKDLN